MPDKVEPKLHVKLEVPAGAIGLGVNAVHEILRPVAGAVSLVTLRVFV
jgi:hypothetical protein